MRTINIINRTSFIITLLLYLTIFYGMLAQIFLGIIQIILSIVIITKYRSLITNFIKPFCITYLVLSICVLLALPFYQELKSVIIVIFFVVPMCLAGLHLYITTYLSKLNH